MSTVKEMLDRVKQGSPFNLCFGDFLDEFFTAPPRIKQAMIREEPVRCSTIEKHIYVYTAAAVHKLANDHGLAVPPWVFQQYYFLEKPYFSMNARGKLRLLLLYESPPEFKFRNFFEVRNTLSRA